MSDGFCPASFRYTIIILFVFLWSSCFNLINALGCESSFVARPHRKWLVERGYEKLPHCQQRLHSSKGKEMSDHFSPQDVVGCISFSVNSMLMDVFYPALVQNIDGIPDDLKALYKTVWEIPQRVVVKMAADRGAFIDQSQSLNIHIAEPNFGKLTSMHFYAWKLVIKRLGCWFPGT